MSADRFGTKYDRLFAAVATAFTEDFEIDESAQSYASPGDMKYVDQNNDGTISKEDFVVLGNAYPDFFGGLTNNFTYKSFDFSFFLYFMVGQDVFNWESYLGKYGLEKIEYNKYKEVATARWTGPETSNDIPRAGYKPFNISDGPDGGIDVMIEEASFLRLRDVTLTYNLPKSLVSKLGLGNARVYVKGQNLLTITGYSGADPEANELGSSTTLLPMGIAYYPVLKTYMIGLNLGF